MADTFDIRKYLIENLVTSNSRLLKELDIEKDPEEPTGRMENKVWECLIDPANGRPVDESPKIHTVFGNFEVYCIEKAKEIAERYARGFWEGNSDEEIQTYSAQMGINPPGDIASTIKYWEENMGIGLMEFNEDKTACGIMHDDENGYYILNLGKIEVSPEEMNTLLTLSDNTAGKDFMPLLDRLIGRPYQDVIYRWEGSD